MMKEIKFKSEIKKGFLSECNQVPQKSGEETIFYKNFKRSTLSIF